MNPHATAYTTANVDNKKGVAPPMKKTTTAAMKGDKPAEKKPKKMTKKELATQAAALSATSSGSSNHSNNFVSSSAHHPNSAAMSKGGMPPPAMLHQQQQKPLSVEQEIENMTERTSLAQVGDMYCLIVSRTLLDIVALSVSFHRIIRREWRLQATDPLPPRSSRTTS